MTYRIGWSTDSTAGRIETTGARTLDTAIREAKKLARREHPNWDHNGYGPRWAVRDDEGRVVAEGRL